MNWLRKVVHRWLNPMPVDSIAVASDQYPVPMLLQMSSPDNPSACSVVAVRNGFLLCRRIYNQNGPDRVDAVYAATAEDLGPLIVAELAMVRLTK